MLLVLKCGLPLKPEAERLAAIASLVLIFWVTEVLPLAVTALLGSVLAVILQVAPPSEVFAPYADPIIFLFIGAFLVGEAIVSSGLDRKVALKVLSLPWVRASEKRLVLALSLISTGLSMWMSNTAAAVVLMPLATSMLGFSGPASTAVLSVAYGASIGGVATPIGTPPNLIAIGFLRRSCGVDITFGQWVAFGVPLAISLTLAWLLISWTRSEVPPRKPQETLDRPYTLSQKVTGAVFITMVLLWLAPTLAKGALGEPFSATLTKVIPEPIVALIGGILLFFLPASTAPYRPVLSATNLNRIDWNTIILFGGGLSLGSLVLKTGLGEWLGKTILEATGVTSMLGLVAFSSLTALILTEFMSNTAAISLVAPVVYSMATDLGLPGIRPVVAAALSSSMAFVLPVSTPPNAVAYGTGLVPLLSMVRYGLLLDLAALCAVILVTLLLVPI